jgi:sugar phosphate isomerase/epimerase
MSFTRRSFLGAAVLGAVAVSSRQSFAADSKQRKFTLDLRAGSVGIGGDLRKQIDLAAKHGFESINGDAHFLAGLSDAQSQELVESMKSKKLKWGACGLPVEFRQDEKRFKDDLANFSKLAAAVQRAGITRMDTWLMPCHDDLTYTQNLRQHANRLGQCVEIMSDHDLRFGMEYVGPKTLWTSKRFPFIHSMKETRDLIEAIGKDGVGYVLDSWHWYTAGETLDDLKTLSNKDIVSCDLNDAPQGVPVDQQLDQKRELPTATGVIDLKGFLATLVELGYDGPIRAEPFNQPLNELGDEEACAATFTAMRRAFDLVDA